MRGPLLGEIPPISRSCGTCTLCCKTYANHELKKPEATWCVHARKKAGCAIHDKRPVECRAFSCMWLMGMLPEDARPDKVGVVLDVMPNDLQNAFLHGIMREKRFVFLRVTQDFPGAWRRPRANDMLKGLVGQKTPSGHQILLMIQGADRWTIFSGADELEFHPFQHELGAFWSPDGGDAESKVYLDKCLNDPVFMAMREEAHKLLADFTDGERTQTAQLAEMGIVFVEPHRAEKMERYAGFLRRVQPDRTFEVKVMPMPAGWEQFSTEGHE